MRPILTSARSTSNGQESAHTYQPEVDLPPAGERGKASPTAGSERGCDDRLVMSSVLVIDDDDAFRDLVRRMLGSVGFVVIGEADTVATGIAAAHELRPDAALVDVGLPDGDGIALARELSSLPWRPHVVLTSTDPDAATADDVRRSGAHAFVAKDQLPNAPLRRLLNWR
ncbi:MAG: two-component system, NarL family, response regulator DevR [Solirubrobacteraceae bacterium]|jgi:CheY-like chemotaxis protein|nr:two-component system, NarL family, response regulator DevR [Solirubrobacteraceae bacterium]